MGVITVRARASSWQGLLTVLRSRRCASSVYGDVMREDKIERLVICCSSGSDEDAQPRALSPGGRVARDIFVIEASISLTVRETKRKLVPKRNKQRKRIESECLNNMSAQITDKLTVCANLGNRRSIHEMRGNETSEIQIFQQ